MKEVPSVATALFLLREVVAVAGVQSEHLHPEVPVHPEAVMVAADVPVVADVADRIRESYN